MCGDNSHRHIATNLHRLEYRRFQCDTHVQRWAEELAQRPAVKRGRMVNRVVGAPESQLHERHDAGDFDTRTQDKIKGA